LNIRSITLGISDDLLTRVGIKETSEDFFPKANNLFESKKIKVVTNRLNFEVINKREYLNVDEIFEKVKIINWAAKKANVRWYCIPFTTFVDYDLREIPKVILEIVKRYPSAFTNLMVASKGEINLKGAQISARLIKDISKLSSNGYDNFRFGSSFNTKPCTPFFPYTHHEGRSGFSLALEIIDVFFNAINNSEVKEISQLRHIIIENLVSEIVKISNYCRELELETGMKFYGLDVSLAPFPAQNSSVANLIELFGVESFGSHGTLFYTSLLTDILKEAIMQSGVTHTGFNGVMFSLLEDTGMAKRNSSNDITLHSLLSYSSVCGCGIDMVPIPGDSFEEDISSLIIDVASLSTRLDKPLGVRLLPVPSKKQNEFTEFNYDFLCNTRIMDIGVRGCNPDTFKGRFSFLSNLG